MIALIIILLSLILSIKNKSSIYWGNGIDAAFQISNKPSDTRLYYTAFTTGFDKISDYMFYQYPYFLKLICFPFNNSLFGTLSQAALVFLLLDLLVKDKRHLLLFISSHALIYTLTNFFKDNLIIIIGLITILALRYYKNLIIQILIAVLSILLIGMVRPFFYMFLPFTIFPLYPYVKSKRSKKILIIVALLILLILLVVNWGLVMFIASSWDTVASVQDEKSSPPVALIKVFLGPGPRHYLFHDSYFEQPFLDEQGCFFYFMHIVYYVVFSYVVVNVIQERKNIFNIFELKSDQIYMLLNSLTQLVIYVIAYGSAEIRQRAIIILFLYLYIEPFLKDIFFRKVDLSLFILFCMCFFFLSIITLVA